MAYRVYRIDVKEKHHGINSIRKTNATTVSSRWRMSVNMKLAFLFTCIIVGLAFELVPYDSEPVDLFLLADVSMPFKTWLYFAFEHLVLVMLSYVIAFESKTYVTACKAFFYFQIFDLIDYLLTYNTQWFGIVSFNTIGMIVFAAFIVYEYVRVSD